MSIRTETRCEMFELCRDDFEEIMAVRGPFPAAAEGSGG